MAGLTPCWRKSIKEGLFYNVFNQREEDGHHPFSAVTITSRLDSNPLTGGLFVSESEEAQFCPPGILKNGQIYLFRLWCLPVLKTGGRFRV